MKTLFTVIFTLFVGFCCGQIRNDYSLRDSSFINIDSLLNVLQNRTDTIVSIDERGGVFTIQSSCSSPTGSMNSTISPPPSYSWLQTNGYCNPANYGKNGTVCWTFTPTQPSITINSGYSVSGCTSVSFGSFNLYTCAPACTLVGTGLTFNVPANQCYTWCMSYSASGPPTCHFNDFCPYYMESNPLPIELLYFTGYALDDANTLEWVTLSETNCYYYDIERTEDNLIWTKIGRIQGANNSTQMLKYTFRDFNFQVGYNYYRLKQVDYNGSFKYYGIVAVSNDQYSKSFVKVTNLLGEEVDANAKGVLFYYYSDGSVVKQYRQ